MIRRPGLPAGQTSQELVGSVDLGPTVLDLAGVEKAVDGRSLRPYAQQPSLLTRRPLLLESFKDLNPNDDDSENVRDRGPNYYGVVLGRYKLIRYFQKDELELYDLESDPHELRNVIDSEAYRIPRNKMVKILNGLYRCKGASCRAEVTVPPPPS